MSTLTNDGHHLNAGAYLNEASDETPAPDEDGRLLSEPLASEKPDPFTRTRLCVDARPPATPARHFDK